MYKFAAERLLTLIFKSSRTWAMAATAETNRARTIREWV
jgi:hypothetical protein